MHLKSKAFAINMSLKRAVKNKLGVNLLQPSPDIAALLEQFMQKHKIANYFLDTALRWYIPFADKLFKHNIGARRPFFLGLNGSQGSGKSTLSDFLASYLNQTQQLLVAVLSLDDFYYTQEKRQQLANDVHPLLATRGVPGTHDCQLIQNTLNALRQSNPISIPRFNKATDNPHPKNHWPKIGGSVDLVIFEGWCWGVPAQTAEQLTNTVNQLELERDSTGIWRNYVNERLAQEYEPLYAQMDYWMMLRAPSFDCVYKWRLEQEQKLRESVAADQKNSAVMNPEQVHDFIQHYQRLTEQSLASLPERCQCIFSLGENRSIQSVEYR